MDSTYYFCPSYNRHIANTRFRFRVLFWFQALCAEAPWLLQPVKPTAKGTALTQVAFTALELIWCNPLAHLSGQNQDCSSGGGRVCWVSPVSGGGWKWVVSGGLCADWLGFKGWA